MYPFEQDGQVLQVVEFQHVKPGKGASRCTKTKNVITGSVVETSYNPTAKFPQAFIERREVTYSYEDIPVLLTDNETLRANSLPLPMCRKTWSSAKKRNLQTAVLQGQGFQR